MYTCLTYRCNDGTAYTFGYGGAGNLATGDRLNEAPVPTLVAGSLQGKQVVQARIYRDEWVGVNEYIRIYTCWMHMCMYTFPRSPVPRAT